MHENSTREQQLLNFCKILHISGRYNLSDLFTKEDKDNHHYVSIRDKIQSPLFRRATFIPTSPLLQLHLLSVILVLASSLSSVGGSTQIYVYRL